MLGATGLIGQQCLQELLKEDAYAEVVSLGRRDLPLKHPKLRQHAVDFNRPDTFADLTKADDVFSCIGTTKRKTPSETDYRKIDFDIPLAVAKLAVKNGAKRLLVVSSVGADPKSSVFYTRLKGELEQALSQLSFEAGHLFRPSFLLGNRAESRPAEALMLGVLPLLSPLLIGPLRPYRAIKAETVAKAMVRAALIGTPGVQFHEFDSIASLGL